jgi:hypothetical protein
MAHGRFWPGGEGSGTLPWTIHSLTDREPRLRGRRGAETSRSREERRGGPVTSVVSGGMPVWVTGGATGVVLWRIAASGADSGRFGPCRMLGRAASCGFALSGGSRSRRRDGDACWMRGQGCQPPMLGMSPGSSSPPRDCGAACAVSALSRASGARFRPVRQRHPVAGVRGPVSDGEGWARSPESRILRARHGSDRPVGQCRW